MIKKLLKKGVKFAGKTACRLSLIPNEIIIRMDGGICSQMHFYLVGEIMRRQGNRVSFDLLWFDEWGKDCDGIQVRNFDLLKMFPSLKFRKATPSLARLMRISNSDTYDYFNPPRDELEWMNYRGPLYMRGYYRDPDDMYPTLFREVFHPDTSILDGSGRRLLSTIEEKENVCAVHVRRGDLAVASPAYGKPATSKYFCQAIQRIRSLASDTSFIIFSDDADWCRHNLLPHLPDGTDACIADDNGSDRGYLDLLLMSRCRHVICSQGSMGRFAALLRSDELTSGHVILYPGPASEGWLSRFPSASFI